VNDHQHGGKSTSSTDVVDVDADEVVKVEAAGVQLLDLDDSKVSRYC